MCLSTNFHTRKLGKISVFSVWYGLPFWLSVKVSRSEILVLKKKSFAILEYLHAKDVIQCAWEKCFTCQLAELTLSWRRPLLANQWTNGLRHERVKYLESLYFGFLIWYHVYWIFKFYLFIICISLVHRIKAKAIARNLPKQIFTEPWVNWNVYMRRLFHGSEMWPNNYTSLINDHMPEQIRSFNNWLIFCDSWVVWKFLQTLHAKISPWF